MKYLRVPFLLDVFCFGVLEEAVNTMMHAGKQIGLKIKLN